MHPSGMLLHQILQLCILSIGTLCTAPVQTAAAVQCVQSQTTNKVAAALAFAKKGITPFQRAHSTLITNAMDLHRFC
jgi:hypothetical protein